MFRQFPPLPSSFSTFINPKGIYKKGWIKLAGSISILISGSHQMELVTVEKLGFEKRPFL